jgi:hypothetical protein
MTGIRLVQKSRRNSATRISHKMANTQIARHRTHRIETKMKSKGYLKSKTIVRLYAAYIYLNYLNRCFIIS